ncbi:uncharacterized protein LOC110020800 isoform X3 [Phalaenopsis equestris]|uniref:uncharacterized protein LOC110020800 isoform X3 n=1 Tax=Phalaenopsis equestris TaxID=78828 RepID=UPI0009E46509|nr:uncharacterized protein LOC110020800 isoform X3 [Phalaenopsis equestris]
MGNCQTAEVVTVMIHHPGGGIERVYWPLTASQIMASNPGHYVAIIITSQTPTATLSAAASPVKHLKILRPKDTLQIGHVYRLVSFEEVLRDFASKKHIRLSRLLHAAKEKRRSRSNRGEGVSLADAGQISVPATAMAADGKGNGHAAAPPPRMRQWRPALQSIEEEFYGS